MGITKKRFLLSTAQYVPKKVEDDWYGRFKRTYHRKKNKKFQCEKFICENLVSGAKTTGIRFSSGKIKIGDDVWRLSNSADFPEYYYETYNSKEEAEKYYRIYPAQENNLKFFLDFNEEEEKEMEKRLEEISERKIANRAVAGINL